MKGVYLTFTTDRKIQKTDGHIDPPEQPAKSYKMTAMGLIFPTCQLLDKPLLSVCEQSCRFLTSD